MLDLEVRVMNKLLKMKEGMAAKFMDERGDTNIISVIMILVVVIGLATLFNDNIGDLANSIWNNINSDTSVFK